MAVDDCSRSKIYHYKLNWINNLSLLILYFYCILVIVIYLISRLLLLKTIYQRTRSLGEEEGRGLHPPQDSRDGRRSERAIQYSQFTHWFHHYRQFGTFQREISTSAHIHTTTVTTLCPTHVAKNDMAGVVDESEWISSCASADKLIVVYKEWEKRLTQFSSNKNDFFFMIYILKIEDKESKIKFYY